MASDAHLSEWAESFLNRLTPPNRALWWDVLFATFLETPVTDETVEFAEAGEPDALATVVFPFIVVFRYLNAETLEIANITWAPGSPGADPELRARL